MSRPDAGSVYVVGAAGPLGKSLVQRLGTQAIPVTRASHGDLTRLDPAGLPGASVVIHLAARTPLNSAGQQIDFLTHNTSVLARVLRAAERGGAMAFVLASSAAVYGTSSANAIPVTAAMRPEGAYGEACVGCEELVQDTAGIPNRAIVRIFNPYGRQGYGIVDRLVAHGLGLQSAPPLWRVRSVRDFVHVDDVARVLEGVAGRSVVCNAGTGVGTSLAELVAMVETAFRLRLDVPDEPQAAFGSSIADVSLLEHLGLLPRISLEDWISAEARRARHA